MSTSGDFVLERTANEIIESALRRARIIPVEQSIADIDRKTALEALNNMIARWQAMGFNLWRQEEYIVPLEQGQQSYFIGPSGDRATLADDFLLDELTAVVAVDATSLLIEDTSEWTGADNVLLFDPASAVADWSTTDATLITQTNGLQLTSTTAASEGLTEYTFTDEVTVDVEYFFEIDVQSLGIDSVRFEVYEVGITTDLIASESVSAIGDTTIFFTSNQTTVIFRYINEDLTGAQVSLFGDLRLKDTTTGEQVGTFIDSSLREWNFVTRVLSTTELELLDTQANEASISASVFGIKSLPQRPLKNDNYRSRRIEDTAEIPVNIWSRKEYLGQVIKDSQGLVTQAYYQPTLVNGRLYVWQVADTVDQILIFSANLPVQVFNDALDEPDFPSEWFDALSWNLAAMVGPEYGIPDNRQNKVDQMAAITLGEPEDWDEESGSLFIGLSRDRKN